MDDGYTAEYYLDFLDAAGFTGPDLGAWNDNRYFMRNIDRKPSLHKDLEPIEIDAYIIQIADRIRLSWFSGHPSNLP